MLIEIIKFIKFSYSSLSRQSHLKANDVVFKSWSRHALWQQFRILGQTCIAAVVRNPGLGIVAVVRNLGLDMHCCSGSESQSRHALLQSFRIHLKLQFRARTATLASPSQLYSKISKFIFSFRLMSLIKNSFLVCQYFVSLFIQVVCIHFTFVYFHQKLQHYKNDHLPCWVYMKQSWNCILCKYYFQNLYT